MSKAEDLLLILDQKVRALEMLWCSYGEVHGWREANMRSTS